MRLLASPSSTRGRLALSADWAFTVFLVGWLCALEFAGRLTASDAHDGLALVALGAAVAVTAARHRRRPLFWVSWIVARGKRVAARIERLKYDHGIDLRGAPPIRRGLPRGAWLIAFGLVGWAVAATVAWVSAPGGWRDVAAHTFYLGYLAALAAVWTGLLICVAAGLVLPIRFSDCVLDRWVPQGDERRTAEVAFLFGYALLTIAIARYVPIAFILAFCLAVGLAALAVATRRGDAGPAILWRAGPGRPVRAIPIRRLLAGVVAVLAGIVLDLLLTACGGNLFGGEQLPESMPATVLLGSLAAWLAPGASLLAALKLTAAGRNDPARRTPPTLCATGADPAAVVATSNAVRSWGWQIRKFDEPAELADVRVEVVSPERSEAAEFEPLWPLKLSPEDLASPNVKDRLFRRDEIQIRRKIAKGLTTLFKIAVTGGSKRKGGYWFAPHWWFVESLCREEPERGRDEPALRPVGPPFAEVFGTRGRQHLHQVLQAVQVDMIYLEAGVGHRVLLRVLRALYELYDVHGGKRKAEDHHFRGIPKVRVIVHEYSPGSRFKVTEYKEIGFDELNRARVLHVFKDRGGHEELEDSPFNQSWEPAPALGVG